MLYDVKFAGFGGQGVMLIGQMLAYAGMNEGREVVWLPSYGPEMRGGTAYCTVVVSDKPIASPVINNPTVVIAMNRPSLDKFGPLVKKGGHLFINSSLIDVTSDRTDISIYKVPCNKLAIEAGDARSANIVMIGALNGALKIVKKESIEYMIRDTFGKKSEKVVNINLTAMKKGMECVQ